MKPVTSPLMQAYARQPASFVRGSGALLWDEQGDEYLDAIAGVAVASLGHVVNNAKPRRSGVLVLGHVFFMTRATR